MTPQPPSAVARSFLGGVAIAIAAAWLAPDFGKTGGTLPSAALSKAGIFAIFFLQGTGLATGQFRASLTRWRLHLFAQAFCFIFFPALTWGALTTLGRALPPELKLGFLFLSVLPMTISSATVMADAAGGDVPSTIFNTALSNIAGVLLVPAAASWILATGSGAEVPFAPLFLRVATLILLPLALGQLARPKLGGWAARHKKRTTAFSNGVIFFLLYTSFCDAFGRDTPAAAPGWGTLGWTLGGSLLFLATFTALAWALARPFPRPQRIAALYCGSQKTLGAGVTFAQAIYATGDPAALPPVAVFLLPLLCYHPLQLVAGGLLAARFSRPVSTPSQTL